MKILPFAIITTLFLSYAAFGQVSELLSPTAKAAVEKENFAPCIAEMTKLIALKPKSDAALVERARCLYLSADDSRDEERLLAEKLKTTIDKALAEKAANTEVLARRKKAIADATQATILNPRNAAAYNIRGLVKSSLGIKDRAEATADFDKAIEIDPKFIKPYFNRGSSRSGNGDYDGAIADFTKVLEFEPNNIAALESRSSAFISKYQGGASLEGIDDLVKLSKLSPNNRKYYKLIEYLILNSAYPYGYADIFKEYIAINPKSPEGYLGLARSQGSVERSFDIDINKVAEHWKTAENAYLKYIELNPNVIEPYIELFDLYYDKARNQVNAQKVAVGTLAKFPNDARSYILRGKMAESKSDWATAVKEFTRAIELNPKLSLAYERRSNAYGGLKDMDKAFADLNKAIETDPRNGEAYLTRGNYYNGIKKYQEAIADFNEADKLKQTCAKTYRGVMFSTIAKDNKEPRQTGNFLVAQRDFLADDAKKCYLTHYMYGVSLYIQGLNDQAAQQFNSALTVYKKHGYDTANIIEFQKAIKAETASTTSQGTHPKSNSGMADIISAYKLEAVKQGAKLIGSGIYNAVEDVEFDLVQGETYILVAVIEGYSPFGIDLFSYSDRDFLKPTHSWDDKEYKVESSSDYAMKSRIVKANNYSTLQLNLGLTTKSGIRKLRLSPNKEKGKPLHWIFYKLK